jgi:hypothetical protein
MHPTRAGTRPKHRAENSHHRSHLAPAPSTGAGAPWEPAGVRKAASIRLGLLLAVSALLTSCSREKADERRCVDGDGQFVDEGHCTGASGPEAGGSDGGVARGATGGWDQADGGTQQSRGGYHFIWIPYGAFGGIGTYAPGYVRSGTGGATRSGTATSGSVTRGGFGATGAAHAGSTGGAHAGSTSAGS